MFGRFSRFANLCIRKHDEMQSFMEDHRSKLSPIVSTQMTFILFTFDSSLS